MSYKHKHKRTYWILAAVYAIFACCQIMIVIRQREVFPIMLKSAIAIGWLFLSVYEICSYFRDKKKDQ